MTFIFGSWTLGAALLYSAVKNMTLLELIRGEEGPGQPGSIVAATYAEHQGSAPPSGTETKGGTGTLATPGHYVDPLTGQATVGRIDQGQDFGGGGPVRAIGNAIVTRTGAPGWPGGAGVEYKLLDGSLKGHCVYVYEGIKVTVRKGQKVRAGQVIGQIIPGTSTGIEMGFSDCHGVPISHGEYTEGKETVAGKKFAQFLKALGVK